MGINSFGGEKLRVDEGDVARRWERTDVGR
jgi:hypothetical protein